MMRDSCSSVTGASGAESERGPQPWRVTLTLTLTLTLTRTRTLTLTLTLTLSLGEPLHSTLRLACLLSLVNSGLRPKALAALQTELLQQHGYEKVAHTLPALHKVPGRCSEIWGDVARYGEM